ncbi:MAG TPA: ATP-binding cassette domain-containing protein, partial [Candidatus Moranbacteria bacterium]|nr:ATP-binding cassette domain-containing protein [Candidatus Moranbacteria bacterium]
PLWYDRRRRSGAEKKRRVEEVLKAVGMFARREHRPAQLSGGERQRAAIARALINDPEIIFADEPTGNLDSVAGANIMRILRTLNDEGRTIVLVTHERQTARAASRILRMKDGSLAGDEAVEDRLSFSNEKEVSLK